MSNNWYKVYQVACKSSDGVPGVLGKRGYWVPGRGMTGYQGHLVRVVTRYPVRGVTGYQVVPSKSSDWVSSKRGYRVPGCTR